MMTFEVIGPALRLAEKAGISDGTDPGLAATNEEVGDVVPDPEENQDGHRVRLARDDQCEDAQECSASREGET